MKSIIIALLWLFSQQSLFAEVVTLEGNSLPRGVENQSSFTIDVRIDDIPSETYQDSYEFQKNVDIQVQEFDSARFLANLDASEIDEDSIGFVVETRERVEDGTTDDGDRFVIVRISIREDTKKFADELGTDESGNRVASIKAEYTAPDNEVYSSNDFLQIVETLQLANAAPDNFELAGGFKSLKFSWTPNSSIEFLTGLSDTDKKTDAPSSAVIVLFSDDANLLDLPTYKFLPDADSDEEGMVCQIDYSKVDTDETCVVCDDNDGQDKIYLNFNELGNYSELTVQIQPLHPGPPT